MIADHLTGIEQFEADLWKVADNLRANSNLASNEYFMPILGLIFLRHATNRYYEAMAAIEEDIAAGRMPERPLIEADFTRRRALMLPQAARYDVLLKMPKDGNLGAAVTAATDAVEDQFPPLAGQLPKDYERFEDDVLEEMMRTFDSEALRTATGDVFGRIYEYFLAQFSKEGAHDNGEFFTPPSIVQTIVNVIKPDHGVVFDPACGSGGMFVQSSHFIEREGEDTMKRATFYGHEKNETTAKLAQINLAVHGLQGTIRAGNEAITYYKDPHELAGRCDFVMANPPFNVDEVDAEKVKGDKRLPFGLPGVNKAKKVSNANYLWLSYFYSYLIWIGGHLAVPPLQHHRAYGSRTTAVRWVMRATTRPRVEGQPSRNSGCAVPAAPPDDPTSARTRSVNRPLPPHRISAHRGDAVRQNDFAHAATAARGTSVTSDESMRPGWRAPEGFGKSRNSLASR